MSKKIANVIFAIIAALSTMGIRVYAAPPGYNLVWSDEFNSSAGSTPNTAIWNYDTGAGGWGNNELETYVNSQANCHVINDSAAIDGQALQIEVQTDTTGHYYSARINTNGKVSLGPYGYIEYRCQLPGGNAQGMWPAGWMLGTNIGTVGWPACGEIDVMEEVNGQDINHGSLHAPGYNPTATIGITGLTSAYHTYGALWQPGSITFYVDGAAYETQTSSGAPAGGWVFDNQTCFVILNLAVGGNFPGNPNSSTTIPADLKVDYVRFYQNNGKNPAEAPFGGTAAAIPGTVQAENYDVGGQGVAFNVSGFNGPADYYRVDGIDLETTADTGGGYDLGWTNNGQWFKYTVNVANPGTYTVGCRVASGASGGTFHIENNSGTNLSGSITVPGTGGWQTWTTVNANVILPPGQQTLKVVQDTGGYNMNYFTFTLNPPAAPTGLTASGSSSSVTLNWTGSTGAVSYNVYRGTSAGGESTTPIATGLTGTTFTDTGLTNGTKYFYKVAAVNSAGTSGLSNEASATPAGPFGGTPAGIPGTVQAENYDTGGQGLAYNVTSINGTANSYRSDGVDLETTSDTGGGYDLGWTSAGQWFNYTVNVASAGTYTFAFRVANGSKSTATLNVQNKSGTNLTGNVNIAPTGGWQTWTTVTATATLPAGQQVLTVFQVTGGFNINYFTVAVSGAHTLAPACAPGSRLDDTGGSTTNGNKLQIWQATGASNQNWTFTNIGGSNYTLSVLGPYCLDSAGATASGTQATIWACQSGNTNQSWTLTPVSGGYTLKDANAGLCLDVSGAGSANGTAVDTYTCNGSNAQTWAIN